MNKPKYIIGKFKDNEVKINQLQRKIFANEIKAAENKEVLIELADPNKIRSAAQNAYYWVVLNQLARDTGTEVWKWHNFFKYTFLHDKIKKMKLDGEELAILPSTTELKISEMVDYLNNIVGERDRDGNIIKPGWIGEHYPEFLIPDPKDYYEQ